MKTERWEITDHAEWLNRRKPNVNGSEVAALFGCNPFMSNLALYADKAGLVPHEAPDSDVLIRGKIMEPSVAEAVRIEHPDWEITKAREYVWAPDARLGCTPDFYAVCPKRGRGVVQAKTTSKQIWEQDWQDGPPQWIVLQTLQEMMLVDAAWGAIAVLICEFPYKLSWRVYVFERHAMAEKRIVQTAAMFWENVEHGTQPAFDYGTDFDVIKQLFPRANLTTKDFTRDNRMQALLTQHEFLGAVKRRVEKRLEPVKAEIAAKMGEAGAAIVPGWDSVTYKNQDRAGFTVEPTSFRVLRTKRAKQLEHAA